MTTLYACKLLDDASFEIVKADLLSHVPEPCAQKAISYYHSNDTQRHLIGELLARYALKNVTGEWPSQPFVAGDKGKPHPEGLNGYHFNVSHSGQWVVVALSDDIVGVDIERIRRVPEGVAYRYFSEPEKKLLDHAENETEKAHIFFTLWTLKESFLKAIGKGLTKSLSSFTVLRDGNAGYKLESDVETEGFHLKVFPFEEGYKLAACSKAHQFNDFITIVNISDLT